MKDYTTLFNKAIDNRLHDSQWDEKIAKMVTKKIRRRKVYTLTSIAASVILVIGFVFFQSNRKIESNPSAYGFVNAQANGVLKTVFPDAQEGDLAYSYIDDHVTNVIETALLER